MDNFQEALKLEEEYHKLRLDHKAKTEFNFVKKLNDLGYTTEKYMQEKTQKIITDMKIEIKEIDTSIVMEEIMLAHKKEGNTCLIGTQNFPIVYVGTAPFNEQFCVDNKIPIYRIGYGGGSIIAGNKDITLGIVLNRSDMMSYFKNKLKTWISENFSLPTLIDNDLMIGDNKVVGTAIRTTGNKSLYCIQISFDVDLELIKKITMKEMIKIPKGLSSFGTKTREDLIIEVKKWLQ